MTVAGLRTRWVVLRDDWLPVIALLGAGVFTLVAVGLHRYTPLSEAAGSKPYNLLVVYGLYVVVQLALLYDPGASVQHRFLSSYRWFLCLWSLTYSEKVLLGPLFLDVRDLWIRGMWQAAFEGGQAWFLLDAVLALSHAPSLVPAKGGLAVRFVGWLRRVIVRRTSQDLVVRHWAVRHLGVRSGAAAMTALTLILVPLGARLFQSTDKLLVEGIQSLPLGLVFALSHAAICVTLFAMRPQEYLPRSRPFRVVFLGLPLVYGVFQPAVSCLLIWHGADMNSPGTGSLWELNMDALYAWAGLLKVPYSFLVGVVVLLVRNLTRLDREVAAHALSGLQAGVAVVLLPSERLLLRNDAGRAAFLGSGMPVALGDELRLRDVLAAQDAGEVLGRAQGRLPSEFILRLGGRATIVQAARIDMAILSPLHDPAPGGDTFGGPLPDSSAVLLLVRGDVPEDLAWEILGEQAAVRDSQLFHEMRRPLNVVVSLLERIACDERVLGRLDPDPRRDVEYVFDRIRNHLYPQVTFLMLARKFEGNEDEIAKLRRDVPLADEVRRIVDDFQATAASPTAELLGHLGIPAAARRLCATRTLVAFDGPVPAVTVHVAQEAMDLVLSEALHNAARAAAAPAAGEASRHSPIRVRVTLRDDGATAHVEISNAFVAPQPDPHAVRRDIKSRPRGGSENMRALSRLMPAKLEADVDVSTPARPVDGGWLHRYDVRLNELPVAQRAS